MQVGENSHLQTNVNLKGELDTSTIPHCCKNTPNILRVYDNGDGTTESILVCSEHSTDQAFCEGVIKEEILK